MIRKNQTNAARLLHTLNGDMEVFFVLPCGVSDNTGVLSFMGQRGVLDAEDMTVAMGTILDISMQQLR